jgi:hypothetical protein
MSAFGDAVAWRYLSFNPIEHAVPPRGLYALWVLAATTGVRRSVLAHLDRDGLNLDDATLVISTTRVVVAGHAAESDGKNENSRRIISLLTSGSMTCGTPMPPCLWMPG